MAGGGAGDIYSSPDLPGQVIKIYRNPADRQAYEPKIEAMMGKPPRFPPLLHNGQERHQLAWPTLIAETERGEFLGFAMPEIDFSVSVSLERMLQKRMRAKTSLPEFYGYRVSVAHNLAASVAEMHAQDHHIIDLKPVNCRIYTDNMTLALLDCDGFSINSKSKRFKASQFTPEYIAPEAKGKSPGELGVQQDLFALAVVIFRLLNNGLHPFQAKLASGQSGGTLQEMIEAGYYPFGIAGSAVCIAPRQSVHDTFPDDLRKAFDQAFLRKSRPTAAKWRDLLRQYADPSSGKLIRCNVDPHNHAHFGHGCGWCVLEGNQPTPTQKRQRKPRTNLANVNRRTGTPNPSASLPSVNLAKLSPLRSWWAVFLVVISIIIAPLIARSLTDTAGEESGIKSAEKNNQRLQPPKVTLEDFIFDTSPIYADGIIITNANLRSLPTASSEIYRTLPQGTRIRILLKVVGRNWYYIEEKQNGFKSTLRRGRSGYVFGDLLTDFK